MSNSIDLVSDNTLWRGTLDESRQSYRENVRVARALLSVGLVSVVVLCAMAVRILASDYPRYPLVGMPVLVSHPAAKAPAGIGTPACRSTFTGASVITATEVIVLQQVAQQLSCPSDVLVDGTTYSVFCVVAMGHSITVRMRRFTSPAEARAAFDSARGDRPLQYFRCYPSYSWQYDESPTGLVMRHRIRSWQAERWLIYIEAFDDTGYLIAPEPAYVSELVYQAAREHDLFAAQIYLPYALRQ